MSERRIEFDANSLLKLFTHYSEGDACPLDAKLVNLSVSQRLPRWIALIIEANEFQELPFETGDGYGGQQPIFLRYEGKRVLTLNHIKDQPEWGVEGAIEAPKHV